MAEGTDLFEIIQSTRAMRRLKPDPVPDELIRRILQAGQCAPNGGNSQRWHFLVVKDPKIKQQVQPYYRRAFDEHRREQHAKAAPPPGGTVEGHHRQNSAVEYLTDHFHEAPVWIVPCLEERGSAPVPAAIGASIHPAVQNMPLTARAPLPRATLATPHLVCQQDF